MKQTASTIRLLLTGAAIALAAAGAAQAADKAPMKHGAVTCADGTHATDKATCDKSGGATQMTTKADTTAVQTESAKVNATGQAPQTGAPSKTPAKPDSAAK
ncbi:hypothetical protein GT347_03620 [Xylophilus rhododendri]|uniref:Uncharacterized protein n=1 Tax=Xylophilus rhododendri TaxID=2697032 RepID=A0A857J2Q2_9BURK|nr:hypothetical protein [Xylophilus rhododendri]QHI97145.1 hypothetical protein GT347_03620 [Xylophilus rhododendri]